MTNYINTTTLEYPITEQQIKLTNPNKSFEVPFKAPENYQVVFSTPQPTYNSVTQIVKELKPTLTSKGNYEQAWEVVSKFSDYVDANGVLHTREEQESEALAQDEKIKIENLVTSVTNSVQKRLDDFAKTRGYDGILSACTYATDSDPKFNTEGQYCVSARGSTWRKLHEIVNEVEQGIRPIPSGYPDIEPELPELVWPN